MKINVQTQKEWIPFIVDIPQTLDLNHISPGEFFSISVHGLGVFQVCYLADGRSLLIGDQVVRISQNFLTLKNDQYRMGLKIGGKLLQKHFFSSVVRSLKQNTKTTSSSGGVVHSPMNGKLISLAVQEGSQVKVGDLLVVIEAMKMENRIASEFEGVVKDLKVTAGSSISAGDVILTIENKEM